MPSTAPTRTGFTNVNGAQISWEEAGSGFPLVLIHAGIADSRMWDDQMPVFAQHYRVIRYDVRGCGRSIPPTGPFTHHADLHALLQLLGVERTYLVGVSMGGTIAIDFTLAYPAMVRALITVGSRAAGAQPSEQLIAAFEEVGAALEAGDIDRANEIELRMWVDGPHRGPDEVDPHVRERVREMNRNNFAVASEDAEMTMPDVWPIERLGEIETPTLVMYGDLDQPDIVAGADVLVTRIKGARKVAMAGTAHMPSMERPAEFNQIVLDFLGEVGRGSVS